MVCDEEGKVNEAYCLIIISTTKGKILKIRIQPN
jgi:hypothetical protein